MTALVASRECITRKHCIAPIVLSVASRGARLSVGGPFDKPMLNRLRALCVTTLLTLLGCSGTDGPGNGSPPPSQSGAGGHQTSGGSASGGSANQPGAGGSANGGASSDFGVSGSGGSSAGAGLGLGLGGSSGSSGGGGTNGRGPAPTFSTLYDSIITPNCGGSQCHLKRPTPFGYDFSSKSAASASFRADVRAGDAENSPMFQVLNLAIMPKDKPPLTIEQLFMIYDWINAGALDN